MASTRYVRWISAPEDERVDGGAIRAESSDPRRRSATVTSPRFPFFGTRVAERWCHALALTLLVGTAACSAPWTGSVGAVLGKSNTDGRIFVRDAPPEMGAAKAGIAIGDEVVAIDGKPVTKLTPPEVHEALAGKVGTKVRVTIVRNGVSIEYVVERGPLSGT